jgi:hypothetical protein
LLTAFTLVVSFDKRLVGVRRHKQIGADAWDRSNLLDRPTAITAA